MVENEISNLVTEIVNELKPYIGVTFKGEDLYDYTYIKKGKYLPVDIAVDTSFSYEVLGIIPSLMIRNGYEYQNEFIPIPLCADPHRFQHSDLNITLNDYYTVENFVAKNYKQLLQIAHDEIDLFSDFLWKYKLTENTTLINEMAMVRPSQSGLKKKIWLDDGNTFEKGGHWLRIKVQDKGQNSHNWPTLTIPDYKWIGGEDIDNEEKKRVVKYVKLNIELLTALLLKKIDIEEYLTHAYKVDDKGLPIKQNDLKEWIYVYDAKHNISVYKHSFSPFGYIYSKDGETSLFNDNNNKPLIFDKTTEFNSKGLAYANIGDNLYLLNIDGTFSLK